MEFPPRDWAQRNTGQYLRWEVLGLLFSAIGILILDIAIGPDTDNLDIRVRELRAQIEQVNDAMPAFAKAEPEQLLDDVQHSVN
ncbi:hypothetical protein MBLNU13_g07117t1 [Cladosporium sp. NU13]